MFNFEIRQRRNNFSYLSSRIKLSRNVTALFMPKAADTTFSDLTVSQISTTVDKTRLEDSGWGTAHLTYSEAKSFINGKISLVAGEVEEWMREYAAVIHLCESREREYNRNEVGLVRMGSHDTGLGFSVTDVYFNYDGSEIFIAEEENSIEGLQSFLYSDKVVTASSEKSAFQSLGTIISYLEFAQPPLTQRIGFLQSKLNVHPLFFSIANVGLKNKLTLKIKLTNTASDTVSVTFYDYLNYTNELKKDSVSVSSGENELKIELTHPSQVPNLLYKIGVTKPAIVNSIEEV